MLPRRERNHQPWRDAGASLRTALALETLVRLVAGIDANRQHAGLSSGEARTRSRQKYQMQELKRLKLATHLLARRLLFREFFLQAVYVIDSRTDLLKRRGVVCIRPRACKKVSTTKQITHASPATRCDTRRDGSSLLNPCIGPNPLRLPALPPVRSGSCS